VRHGPFINTSIVDFAAFCCILLLAQGLSDGYQASKNP